MALVLITTPIGNDEDITLNAKSKLVNSDILYCEDTRKSKELLKRLEIDYSNKRVYSFHDHSSEKEIIKICELAKEQDVLYLSDAGSPIVSDPAFPLIKQCLQNNIKITSASGITAPIYALEVSGLPSNPFTFHGFIGRQSKDLNAFANKVMNTYGTHIIFEGVARVEKTISFLCEKFPDFKFVIARELTKTYEEILRFEGKDFSKINSEITYKGEFVVLFNNPISSTQVISEEIVELAHEVIDSQGKGKSLAKLLSKCTGRKVKEIYSELNK